MGVVQRTRGTIRLYNYQKKSQVSQPARDAYTDCPFCFAFYLRQGIITFVLDFTATRSFLLFFRRFPLLLLHPLASQLPIAAASETYIHIKEIGMLPYVYLILSSPSSSFGRTSSYIVYIRAPYTPACFPFFLQIYENMTARSYEYAKKNIAYIVFSVS